MKCPTLAACYGRRHTATTMMVCYIGVLLCCCASLAAASNYYDVMGEHPVAYELVCPENEELRDTMPCCEPTCDHDCSNAKCSNAYVRQPTCVCKEGYVRHKGKCIRLRQCPAKPPVPPMCGDNEELLPSPPSCEPTCTDDCAGRPVHSRYLDQPTCVCKKGYRRHKGKCIRVDQCPSCGPYATLTESAPCCEPTCDNDCSNVLCISPVQTGEPKCVCQDGYVKHNSTCIKRELCPKTVYYVPKQFCRCGGKRKPKGRVPVKYVEATTPAPPCACQQQSEALSPDYYPAVTYSPASYPPMVYVSSPYVATTTPATPCARPTNPPPRYAPQPPQNYAPPKYAPYQPPATCAPPPAQYTAPPTTCAPPTAPPRPYYQPSPPPSYTPPKYLPAPPPPPYSYTAPPRVEASTCAPPKPSYRPAPCNGPPPPPPPSPPPPSCGSSVTMQPPSYQYQPTPPPAPKPYTYPATTPQPYAYQPTTPRPYYQQPPSSYQDQPYYAIPALKQCSCSINAATGGPPCGAGCARHPPISFNVATPSTTTAAPTTTVCPPACPCQFQYNQQHPVAYQDQPYVPQPPTTTARQPVDVPFIPLAGPNCYTPPPGCPAGVPVGVPGGAPGSGSYFSVGGYGGAPPLLSAGGYGGAPPLLSAGGYGGAPLVSAGGYGGAPPLASVGGYGGAPPVASAGGYGGSAPPVVSAGGYDGSLAAATAPGGDSIATAGAPSGPFLSVLRYGV